MKELQDILRLVHERPGPLALATLVRAQGASYRRTGARLLLDASGPLRGSLSGDTAAFGAEWYSGAGDR